MRYWIAVAGTAERPLDNHWRAQQAKWEGNQGNVQMFRSRPRIKVLPMECCSAAPSWEQQNDTHPRLAVLWAFNRIGDFDNAGDTAAGLREILEESFRMVEIDVFGSTAHFTASSPRQAAAQNF